MSTRKFLVTPGYLLQSYNVFNALGALTPFYKDAIDAFMRRIHVLPCFSRIGICVIIGPNGEIVNWLDTSTLIDQTGAPSIVANSGWKGDGISNDGFRIYKGAAASGIAIDSQFQMVFTISDSVSAGFDFGNATGFHISARYSDGGVRGTLGSGVPAVLPVASSLGAFGVVRRGSIIQAFHDNIFGDEISAPGNGLSEAEYFSTGYQGPNPSDRRIFACLAGGAPDTNEELAEIASALTEYFQRVNGVFEISCAIDNPSGGAVDAPYRVFNAGKIYASGNIVGTSLDVLVKITPESDPLTTILDYTVTDETVSTGPWSGFVEIPEADYGSNYKQQAKLSDDSGFSPRTFDTFGVGRNRLTLGDSHMGRLHTEKELTIPMVGDVRRYVGAGIGAEGRGGWPLNNLPRLAHERGGVLGGDGAVVLSNEWLSIHPTWAHGMIFIIFGGTTALEWTDVAHGGTPLPNLAINMWDVLMNIFSSAESYGHPNPDEFDAIYYSGSISDNGRTAEEYAADLQTLMEDLRTWCGKPDMPFITNLPASSEGNASLIVTPASLDAVRQGKLLFYDNNKATNNVYLMNHMLNVRLDRVAHFFIKYYCCDAVLWARAEQKALGERLTGACGAEITSLSIVNNNFEFTVTHEGGTALQGQVDDVGLMGVTIEVDGTERIISTCEILSATTFGGTFLGDPIVTEGRGRYIYGNVLDGLYYPPVWSNSTTYGAGDYVTANDNIVYQSIAGGNINHSPVTTTGFWNSTGTGVVTLYTPNYVLDNDVAYITAHRGTPVQPTRGWMDAT